MIKGVGTESSYAPHVDCCVPKLTILKGYIMTWFSLPFDRGLLYMIVFDSFLFIPVYRILSLIIYTNSLSLILQIKSLLPPWKMSYLCTITIDYTLSGQDLERYFSPLG